MNAILSSRTSNAMSFGAASSSAALPKAASRNQHVEIPAVSVCTEHARTLGQPMQAKRFWLPTALSRSNS